MTRNEAHEAGYDVYCYGHPVTRLADREKARVKFEAYGYTTVEFTETFAGFPVLFLGIKIHKPTRAERGCLL